MNARHDAGGGYRHAWLGDAHIVHQQTHRFHEIVIVEERLPHAHENQVYAILWRRYFLILQDGTNLTHNLTSGQIALDAELRREAELAIHGAPHLAGDADRGPVPIASSIPLGGISRLAAIPCLSPVAFGHPHGFHALTVGKRDEITHRPIFRHNLLFNPRPAHGDPLTL